MPITHTDYVPILKWRQGEYQALLRLPDAVKDRTVPLIEVTPQISISRPGLLRSRSMITSQSLPLVFELNGERALRCSTVACWIRLR